MRPLDAETPADPEMDPIDAALAWHDGDARSTIATLLDDCRYLREQLTLASATMSRGMARGWAPKLDRD